MPGSLKCCEVRSPPDGAQLPELAADQIKILLEKAYLLLKLSFNMKVVLKLTVRVGKVKKIDHQGHPLQMTWHQHGYDTAWVPPNCGMVPSGMEEDCVWDPKHQIKISLEKACLFLKLRLNMGKPRAPTLKSNGVPKHGRKYTMYHGTSTQNAQLIKKNGFRPSAYGMLGPGVYMSRNVTKAKMFPLGVLPNQKVVLKLTVNVGKVKKIDYHGHPMQTTWHQHGYNTAWCPPNCGMVPSGMEEDCVWNPKHQIKILLEKAYLFLKLRINMGKRLPLMLRSNSVPKRGRRYTMYHGTSAQAATLIKQTGFRPSADGMLGPGVYVSRDAKKAGKYPLNLPPNQRVVLKLTVNVGKVKKIDYQGHPMQKTWHTVHGYDTAWVPPNCGMVPSGQEEDCVWDPKRIKFIKAIHPKQG
ncbi:hypothetical protein AGOR_G00030360 [Albula goreensis]|uniref:Grass carp reovirus (GCRV)-induced gene 2p n=1 Tax=Albula goreensis TaxID=1534307 RepID=A0A8T3E3D4_9TELE|nr:hypothetical protein AGOR_G00030360 [Albula goreensis]